MRKLLTILSVFLLVSTCMGARDTNVKTAVYKGGHVVSTTLTISSVSWSTDAGTITLSATVPAGTDTGYVITDTGGNSYVIRSWSGAVLTCQDFDSATDPVTGGATSAINSAYSTIQAAEDDFDVTTLYTSGDTATVLIYSGGGAYDEAVIVNGGGTVGLSTASKFTVPEDNRHDGTDGTGSRLVRGSAWSGNLVSINVGGYTLEWLEIDGNNQANSTYTLLNSASGTATAPILKNLIVHDANPSSGHSYGIRSINGALRVLNTIVYDVKTQSTGAGEGIGISSTSGANDDILNSTVYNTTVSGASSANCHGIQTTDGAAGERFRNNISMGTNGSNSGTIRDFSPTSYSNATVSHNMSEDATASGTGSLVSKTVANQFVSTTGGSEDLHIQDTDADSYEAGTDLGTTPTGVNFDIDNFNRNAGATTWSIGAHDGNNLRGAGAATVSRRRLIKAND